MNCAFFCGMNCVFFRAFFCGMNCGFFCFFLWYELWFFLCFLAIENKLDNSFPPQFQGRTGWKRA